MLQLREIKKQYKTGELVQQALAGVSFNLRDNEFVSILGPSGSGKTTLLNIIGGLDRYDSGDLLINGISTKKYKDRDWDTYRNHTIGFVFQSYNLIPHQSILANVELALTIGGVGISERRERAKNALAEVGLGEQIHKRPNQLSGGQMQRVAIARALVNDPDILLADEPTGALDSETSVQIMELLKKVAEDRLVVMVTHNGELAEEYSTRIIRLKDGKIVSDSNPCGDAEIESSLNAASGVLSTEADSPKTTAETGKAPAAEAPAEKASASAKRTRNTKAKNKKAKMSFTTSMALSFNNLRSKKGRTVLISLASSIGIIGIALILAISTGVNNYIADIQKETMSSYPITISAQTIDLNGLMTESSSMMESKMDGMLGDEDDGRVHSDYSTMEASDMFSSSYAENDLTEFKKYLDDPDCELVKYLGENGISYSYDLNFNVFTRDENGNLINTNSDVSELQEEESASSFSMMTTGMSNMRSLSTLTMGSGSSSTSAFNFSEMIAGTGGSAVSKAVTDSYDVLSGRWPESYDEVVIRVEADNTIPVETLYQLGYITGDKYLEVLNAYEEGSDIPDIAFDYTDLCDHTFYLLNACDRYVENEDGTFSYLSDDSENLLDNAIELKVVGVIRAKEAANYSGLTTTVVYTSLLTDYCIERSNESSVIKAQEASPDINVLTGVAFDAVDTEQKVADATAYIRSLSDTDKASMYTTILYYQMMGGYGDSSGGFDLSSILSLISGSGSLDLSSLLGGGSSDGLDSLMDMYSASTGGSSAADLSDLMSMYSESSGESADTAAETGVTGAETETSEAETTAAESSGLTVSDSNMASMMDKWLDETPDETILVSIYDEYLAGSTYEDNIKNFGKVSYDSPTSINIYADTFEDKDAITACINEYNASAAEDKQIVYTDYIALITTSITTIVNAISYVLIAFVAVSLIVSCIMIGIITHISVLERIKEIGILRAIGASKRNISRVFNAETVIIGLFSGLLGVVIAMLLCIPINAILRVLIGSELVNVGLPATSAIILILISVAVTLIGGLIPAKKAAKLDPVVALRSE